MELEALLLGLEPATAIAVGIGAVVLAPVVSAVGSFVGQNGENGQNSNPAESLAESAKEVVKNGLVWGFEAYENAQSTFAQAEESFRDLLADAKTEHMEKKAKPKKEEPYHVEIVGE